MTSSSACEDARDAVACNRPMTLMKCAQRSAVIGVAAGSSTLASSAFVIQISAAGTLTGK
jgi:hypothetical protein